MDYFKDLDIYSNLKGYLDLWMPNLKNKTCSFYWIRNNIRNYSKIFEAEQGCSLSMSPSMAALKAIKNLPQKI
jgi:hypothetical protein